MEEEAGIKEVINGNDEQTITEEIYTKVVRAGKRTYFFDVKATRKEDYYLTITESKKRLGKEGKIFYEKHKIFLYKEDFDKFADGLKDAVTFIGNGRNELKPEITHSEEESKQGPVDLSAREFTNVDFDDLGKK
jgi:hypothetical protein